MKYIDPKFFRMKDQIDWKAQGRNMKEIAGIVGELVKETDWKAVAQSMHCSQQMSRPAVRSTSSFNIC